MMRDERDISGDDGCACPSDLVVVPPSSRIAFTAQGRAAVGAFGEVGTECSAGAS